MFSSELSKSLSDSLKNPVQFDSKSVSDWSSQEELPADVQHDKDKASNSSVTSLTSSCDRGMAFGVGTRRGFLQGKTKQIVLLY